MTVRGIGTVTDENQGFTRRAALVGGILVFVFVAVAGGIVFVDNDDVMLTVVSGTEYISGESGQVIIRLTEGGDPVTGASCNATLLYPDKSFVFIDRDMQASSVDGNYYVSFTVPSEEGLYEYRGVCQVQQDDTATTVTRSDSFHVSPALNTIQEMSQSQRRQYENLTAELETTRKQLESKLDNVSNRVNTLEKETRRLEDDLNDEMKATMSDQFNNLSEDFAETARAMEAAFSQNSS